MPGPARLLTALLICTSSCALACDRNPAGDRPERRAEIPPPLPQAPDPSPPTSPSAGLNDGDYMPSERRLDRAIADARRWRPCGVYLNGNTTWTRLIFGDGHTAWISMFEEAQEGERDPRFQRAWLPIADGVALRNDRGFFEFVRTGDGSLLGQDEWTENGIWRRTGAEEECDDVAATPEARTAFSHELCELDGYRLQKRSNLNEAQSVFTRCCDIGALSSCDRAGQLLQLGGQRDRAEALYRRACDGDNARGCHNLGRLLRRADREAADRLFRRACDLGLQDGCNELI